MGWKDDDYRRFDVNIVAAPAEGNLKIVSFTPVAKISYDGGEQLIATVTTENQGARDTFSLLAWEHATNKPWWEIHRTWEAGQRVGTYVRIDPKKLPGPSENPLYGQYGATTPGVHTLTFYTKHWE